MRKNLFLVTLLGGLAFVVAGFMLSAPIGPASSPVISNPTLPFAPALFVLGVVLAFTSVVVYELVPGKK